MKLLLSLLTFCFPLFIEIHRAEAEVNLPRIFCDHMVLQQNNKNTFWGYAKAGERIQIRTSWGEEVTTICDHSQKWKLMVPTPSYGIGHWIEIKAENTIKLSEVAIGEVWLCAGQSNMGFALETTYEVEQDAPKANYPNLRIFRSNREHWHEPLERSRDRLSKWDVCTPEVARCTSAVSFYFAEKLHRELNIPIGIIQKAYAGTPIEGWMPWEVQSDDDFSIMLKKSLELKIKPDMYRDAFELYFQHAAEYERHIDIGDIFLTGHRTKAPAFITKPATLGHQYPGNIYNGMIHPIVPYGIKGVIWYQGERNSKTPEQAEHYQTQLKRLITFYRELWHRESLGESDKNFPFQFTQLPSWHEAQQKPVEGAEAVWSINRESMRLVSETLDNSYMVVSIDTGDPIDLHPYNKKSIGIRHAYQALKHTYNKDFIASGPSYQSHKIKSNSLVIDFKNIGSGLCRAKSGPLNAFAIAGQDRVWYWADAKIDGNNIILKSDQVSEPVAARYAWAMNPSQRNLLYNKEGLPASPFRTDDWPLYETKDAELQIFKPKLPKPYLANDWVRPKMNQ